MLDIHLALIQTQKLFQIRTLARTIPPKRTMEPEDDPLYNMTGVETDAAKAFVWDLADLLAKEDREAVADLIYYPVNVTVSGGTYRVETPEELLDYYDEAIGTQIEVLIEQLDYHRIFAHNGLISVGEGAAWFGPVSGEGLRLFTLQNSSTGFGVRPVESGISAG